MNANEAAAARVKLHTRSISVSGYRRADGMWDIEGRLTDVREQDIEFESCVRLAGEPLHAMRVTITVDATLTIRAAHAETSASPYPGVCERITPDYAQLAGVRVAAGFRREVARLFAGLRGCTHISELLGSMGAVAIQTVGPELEARPDQRPAKVDGCHALDASGDLVARVHPLWYRPRE